MTDLETKPRCQSCGMPLSQEFANHGTFEDGSIHQEYCIICFKNGEFVLADQTLELMIESSIDNMVNEVGMPLDKASELANSFIPTLKRWQK